MASSILEEFQKSLQTQWTRPVACQNKCEPNPCLCQRHIVHVDLVREWWLKEMSDNSKRTKLHRLLDELSIPQHRIFPLQYKDIVNGDQSSLLVYSLLLKQGHGHLVDIFTRSDMRDQYIAITRSDSNEILHKDLSTVEPTKAASILAEFHKERWQYCPLRLTLDMNHTLYGTNVILPFCHKIQLGDKGGTASIYMVAVQKDLIQDDSLRLAISDSRYTDPIFGEVVQLIR